MNKQVLSIEQMQHLEEIGVDISGASMKFISVYPSCDYDGEDECQFVPVGVNFHAKKYNEGGRTFTLQDMLSMMPHTIDDGCNLNIYFHDEGISIYYEDSYECQPAFYSDGNIINVAYEMLCWLAENEYLNKDK